ncbi:MAG: HEAT repeat domain-containing protein [Gemmatimonadota bacterium]|nr:MAG: HEAT repeat domain-containing protein [Gemmatimonadota bacterium]
MTDATTRDQEQLQDATAVVHLMQAMVKGLRAVQLYLPNNPVYQRAIDNVKRAFDSIWAEFVELDLVVAETDLLLGEEVVLAQPNKSESIAWVLFKDGLRSLSFAPGVQDDEVIRFLNVIHKVRTLPADAADDLLTLLWDEDFQFIRYHAVELAIDEVPTIVSPDAPTQDKWGYGGAPAKTEVEMKQAVAEEAASAKEEAAAEGEPPPGVVRVEDFDSTLYFLDETEIGYLRQEIEREYSRDLRENTLSMLFDLLELQTYSTVRAELISIVENFIPYLLAVGDFNSVAYVLREIRVVLQRARELLPEHRETLQHLPSRLSEADALGQLLQSLDEAMVHPSEEELAELFRELRPDALEAVLAWLPKLTNERVRALLDAAARRLAQAHPEVMVNALKNPDEVVLLEAIRLAKQSKLPPTVPALGALVVKGSVPVKRAAVDALAAIGSTGAMQQLERAIDDRDRDVRVAAVRVMANQGYRGAFPAVEAAISGKSLKDADLTERTVFFEAYGALAGAAGLEKLEPMLQVGGFMRRKFEPQIRACAAMAIGKIGTPEARRALEKVTSDKDPLVRNAAVKALREMR